MSIEPRRTGVSAGKLINGVALETARRCSRTRSAAATPRTTATCAPFAVARATSTSRGKSHTAVAERLSVGFARAKSGRVAGLAPIVSSDGPTREPIWLSSAPICRRSPDQRSHRCEDSDTQTLSRRSQVATHMHPPGTGSGWRHAGVISAGAPAYGRWGPRCCAAASCRQLPTCQNAASYVGGFYSLRITTCSQLMETLACCYGSNLASASHCIIIRGSP